jgi:hypothetical protein
MGEKYSYNFMSAYNPLWACWKHKASQITTLLYQNLALFLLVFYSI